MSNSKTNWPDAFLLLCFTIPWILGIAVSKGFWLTFASSLLPPVAWVVLASHYIN